MKVNLKFIAVYILRKSVMAELIEGKGSHKLGHVISENAVYSAE